MKVTRKSPYTQEMRTKEIPITPIQWEAWKKGMSLQEAAPNLSPDDREFIISGSTSEDWDATFGEEDEPKESSSRSGSS